MYSMNRKMNYGLNNSNITSSYNINQNNNTNQNWNKVLYLIQYNGMFIISIFITIAIIDYIFPKLDTSKGDFNILFEITAQLFLNYMAIIYIKKFVNYIPYFGDKWSLSCNNDGNTPIDMVIALLLVCCQNNLLIKIKYIKKILINKCFNNTHEEDINSIDNKNDNVNLHINKQSYEIPSTPTIKREIETYTNIEDNYSTSLKNLPSPKNIRAQQIFTRQLPNKMNNNDMSNISTSGLSYSVFEPQPDFSLNSLPPPY